MWFFEQRCDLRYTPVSLRDYVQPRVNDPKASTPRHPSAPSRTWITFVLPYIRARLLGTPDRLDRFTKSYSVVLHFRLSVTIKKHVRLKRRTKELNQS